LKSQHFFDTDMSNELGEGKKFVENSWGCDYGWNWLFGVVCWVVVESKNVHDLGINLNAKLKVTLDFEFRLAFLFKFRLALLFSKNLFNLGNINFQEH
jgi:hypothetical protein